MRGLGPRRAGSGRGPGGSAGEARDQPAQATCQTRHSAAGSDSGSPWTSDEVGRPALADHAGVRLAEQLAAVAGGARPAPATARGRPRPGTRPPRPAGWPGSSRRRSRCRPRSSTPAAVREPQALVRPLRALGDLRPAVWLGEPRQVVVVRERPPRLQHGQRGDERDAVRGHRRPRRRRRAGSRARASPRRPRRPTRAPGSSPSARPPRPRGVDRARPPPAPRPTVNGEVSRSGPSR